MMHSLLICWKLFGKYFGDLAKVTGSCECVLANNTQTLSPTLYQLVWGTVLKERQEAFKTCCQTSANLTAPCFCRQAVQQ